MPREGALLAIDLGLRIGWALFTRNGTLLRYGSQHFGSRAQLKRAAASILDRYPVLDVLALEGGGDVAVPWLKEADRRGIRTMQVHAAAWRESALPARDRRTGEQAKRAADAAARRVIAESGAPRPTSLRHDAAEAILLGSWACLQLE